MTIILVMSETMSLAAVKARFSELVDRVQRQQDRVVVTRNGKPAAVLMRRRGRPRGDAGGDVRSLRRRSARASEKAVAAGEPGVGLDELRASLEQ